MAGKLLKEEKFLSILKDKQKNSSNSGSYDAYVEALKETDKTITPLTKTDFFKKCIASGGAYAGYTALANEFLKNATNKMTEAEIQSIYGQVAILSETDYNNAVKDCNSTEDYARKDVDLINDMMSKIYAQNDSFNWSNINYDDIKYRIEEVFEATAGYSCGYYVYKDTAMSVDNNKSLMTQEAWLESLKGTNGTDAQEDGETVVNAIYKTLVSKGYTGSIDDLFNLLKTPNGTVDERGYAGANVQENTDSNNNATSNSSSSSSSSTSTGTSGYTNSSSGSGTSSTSTAQVINGKDGRGITAVSISDSGDLVVTYSDNTTQDVGMVRTSAASPQLANPLDALVYSALGIAILSLLANGALAYVIYRVSRKKKDC